MASEGLGELRLIADASAGVLLDHSDVLVTVYTILYDLKHGCSLLLPASGFSVFCWRRLNLECFKGIGFRIIEEHSKRCVATHGVPMSFSLCDQSELMQWSRCCRKLDLPSRIWTCLQHRTALLSLEIHLLLKKNSPHEIGYC
jgi:hypothetical protein